MRGRIQSRNAHDEVDAAKVDHQLVAGKVARGPIGLSDRRTRRTGRGAMGSTRFAAMSCVVALHASFHDIAPLRAQLGPSVAVRQAATLSGGAA